MKDEAKRKMFLLNNMQISGLFAGLHRDTNLFSDNFCDLLLLLRVVFTIVMVALLLLLVGLLHCGKLSSRPEITLIDKKSAI